MTMVNPMAGYWISWRNINYCRIVPLLIGTVAFAVIFAGFWQFFFRGEVVSYGDPSKVYFSPGAAKEGEDIELCFDDIVWKRLCPTFLITHLTPARGPRMDLPSYKIHVPSKAERVPPKCRSWKVPSLGLSRVAGPAVLSGFAESYCTPMDVIFRRPIYTDLPSARIDISRK